MLPVALRLVNIPFPPQIQPLGFPPKCLLPTARLWHHRSGHCPARFAQPGAFPLIPSSLQPSPLSPDCLFSKDSQPREEEQAPGCSVWTRSSCQALICMQRGLGGIYHGLTLGSCSCPRNTLRRPHAVGKIRTGPSATAHALVTLQAADIEIIFIYNLFDHPASKRAHLV